MFETFTSENMQVQNDLAIRYSISPVEVTDEAGEKVTMYDVRRVATKQYSFVGMTREAARRCASVKVAQYTRGYYMSDELVPNLMTEIGSRHAGGHMWQVDISVNEQETRRVSSVPSDPALIFPLRDYDGDEDGDTLRISLAKVTSTEFTLKAESTLKNFNESQIVVQYKQSESSTVWNVVGSGIGPHFNPAAKPFYIRAYYNDAATAKRYYSEILVIQ